MSTPLVSVVMAVHNGEAFVDEALSSILDQTFSDLELIAIDDGSTDGTAGILARHAARDGRLRVHGQPNRGLIASLNRGCGLARGRYIARMDADDAALRDRLHRQVAFLEAHPAVGLLGGAFVLIDETGHALGTIRYPRENRRLQTALLRYNCFCHPTVVMRAEAFQATGGYRKAFLHAEEYDLWLRLAERDEIANLGEPVLRYRVHPQQIGLKNLAQQVRSALGARAAAGRRRQRGEDPTEGVDLITPAVLDRLGVTEMEYEDALRDARLFWAEFLARAGRGEAARRLVAETLAATGTSPATAALRAQADLALGLASLRERRMASGLWHMLRAGRRDPARVWRELRGALARRANSR